MEVLLCATFFYTDKGIIASTKPEWLQEVFDTLDGLFNRVDLWSNFRKRACMLYCSCCAVGTQS